MLTFWNAGHLKHRHKGIGLFGSDALESYQSKQTKVKIRIFDFATYSDFGEEYHFQLLSFYPKFALFDCSIQWDQFPATEIFPELLISIGSRSLCGFSFRWKWFEIKFVMITTCPRDLEYYRRGGSYD